MELVNLLVIIVCNLSTVIWSMKKRFEIKSMEITFLDEEKKEDYDQYERAALERQKLVFEDSKVSLFPSPSLTKRT